MSKNTDEYVIDFVIPCGEVGPTGPIGPASEANICFISYGYKTTSGSLNIENSKIIPTNSQVYRIDGNKLVVEPGTYEITYCGALKKAGSNSKVTLNLEITNGGGITILPDMGISLGEESQFTRFSSTAIFEFPQQLSLNVNLAQVNTTSVEASSVNILIKKIN